MSLDFYSAEERDKINALHGKGIYVYWLSGLCPVQAQGWVDGMPFYFRARGDQWTMAIHETVTMNIDLAVGDDGNWTYGETYGIVPDAGYMPFIEALCFIETSVERFRKQM